MEEDNAWETYLSDRFLSTNQVYAAGLASDEDGVVYACAVLPDENNPDLDKWSLFYKEDFDIEVEGEEGEKISKTINEGQTILTVFNEGYAPDGVWLGGNKYQFIQIDRGFEFEGYNFDVATCARLKGGCHLVKVPGGNILIALYDEEKEQDRGNSKIASLTFAKELAESNEGA